MLVIPTLSACKRETSWNQRLTIVVETPAGEVSSSSVTKVVDTETIGPLVLPEARGVRSLVVGEAVVVEVTPGRYLFALLSGSGDQYRDATHWVYPAYNLSAAGSYFGAMSIVMSQVYDTPIPLPPEGWPLMVTFADIADPTSVSRVDPNDLAASFGEGVRLKAVTLEITDAEVTYGRLEELVTWLGQYPEPHLIPGDGRSMDIPFGMTVAHGDFIRRGEQ
jgi:hypothetical protein